MVRLAAELDVSKVTMRAALRLMEAEGLVAQNGQRRARVVVRTEKPPLLQKGQCRITMLLDRPFNDHLASEREFYLQIRMAIEAAGHSCIIAPKTQTDLNHNVSRVARHFREIESEAWIVVDGRRQVLEWFAGQNKPTLALGGSKVEGMAHAGRDLKPMLRDAIRRLTELGHQRIAFLLDERSQLPHSSVPTEILAEFSALRIPASAAYNTPIWTESEQELHQLLDALFRVTPPTALFAQNMRLLLATLSFMASRGIRVPAQVSLIGGFCDGEMEWTASSPTHYRTEMDALVRHVLRWMNSVARGRPTTEWFCAPAIFVPGASLAPPPFRKN